MSDLLTATLRQLLQTLDGRCDCPLCDVEAYARVVSEHAIATARGYRPGQLRAGWDKPALRRKQER